MWFPTFFQSLSFPQRGRVLFALIIAVFVGALIGISQGPAPQAAAFDARPTDADMLAPVERASIVATAIPLPTKPPADVAAVSAEAVTQKAATQTASAAELPTEATARNVSGVVVARADAFAPESQNVALRMTSAFAGIDTLAPPPVANHWPGFVSLAGGSAGAIVAGKEAALLISDTQTPATRPAVEKPSDTGVASADPQPDIGGGSNTEKQTDSDTPTPAASQPVPEPSSLLLLVVAMIALAVLSRRKISTGHPRA